MSGETHPVRSKNMNSSAFSWASIGACAHAYGNQPLFSVGPLPVRFSGARIVSGVFSGWATFEGAAGVAGVHDPVVAPLHQARPWLLEQLLDV
jgi:hypothetical protein